MPKSRRFGTKPSKVDKTGQKGEKIAFLSKIMFFVIFSDFFGGPIFGTPFFPTFFQNDHFIYLNVILCNKWSKCPNRGKRGQKWVIFGTRFWTLQKIKLSSRGSTPPHFKNFGSSFLTPLFELFKECFRTKRLKKVQILDPVFDHAFYTFQNEKNWKNSGKGLKKNVQISRPVFCRVPFLSEKKWKMKQKGGIFSDQTQNQNWPTFRTKNETKKKHFLKNCTPPKITSGGSKNRN